MKIKVFRTLVAPVFYDSQTKNENILSSNLVDREESENWKIIKLRVCEYGFQRRFRNKNSEDSEKVLSKTISWEDSKILNEGWKCTKQYI